MGLARARPYRPLVSDLSLLAGASRVHEKAYLPGWAAGVASVCVLPQAPWA
jgi:hypothetical protein